MVEHSPKSLGMDKNGSYHPSPENHHLKQTFAKQNTSVKNTTRQEINKLLQETPFDAEKTEETETFTTCTPRA